jgi:hypothetical protein
VTAPDTTGELREAEWVARLAEAIQDHRDAATGPTTREQDYRPGAPCRYCSDYPGPLHEGSDCPRAVANAILPALRALLAERDTLAAKMQAVEGLAEDYEGYVADRGRPAPGSYDHGLDMAQKAVALDLRRALGTPTTGGGE